ncbi:MAG: hypothetical protein V3T05_00995, partial [Myxococcota bacterium]
PGNTANRRLGPLTPQPVAVWCDTMGLFKGLDAKVFAIYAPDKWSSNVHNLARMQAKDAMFALCDGATKGLDEELDGLSRAASDEVPNISNKKKVDAQWVYWFRNADVRKALASFLEKTPLDQSKLFDIAPQDKHVTLAVVLRESALWVGVRVASGATVDRRNLAALLHAAADRQRLRAFLESLPDGATIGLDGDEQAVSATDDATIAAMAGRLGQDDPAWLLGHSVPADEALQLGGDLADYIGRWLGALAPHYRFIAWVPGNDRIGLRHEIAEQKAERQRQALGYKSGDKVRIISGIFSGKVGVVQTIDAKAQVKVQVGTMAVVLSGNDLTPAS